MKKILFIVWALCTFGATYALNPAFNEMVELWDASQSLYTQKNYGKAAKCLEQYIQQCAELPDSLQAQVNLAGTYYNLACYNALAGRKRAAVNAFDKYVDLVVGKQEIDYGFICRDTDLNLIRSDKRFVAAMQRLGEWGDYKTILQKAPGYAAADCDSLPGFYYANPNDRNLVRLRQYYNLDSIAGAGDEISKMINLMTWVHNTVRHDGGSSWPEERTAMAMIELCRNEKRGVNCRMLAMILNECYLAMGFKSRYITCMPKNMVSDCHVINAVYSVTLDKWVWMDPSFNAYVTDENGIPLSIAEVRKRIREGGDYFLNEDANWNNREKQTKESYLDRYMAKNLYYLEAASQNIYGAEWEHDGHPGQYYINLIPVGQPNNRFFHTTDEEWFWQSPYK